MKYLVSFTFRQGGSPADNEAAVSRILELYGKWSPPPGATYLQLLNRVDSGGGYAVVEADNPADIAEATSKFAPYADWQVVPVMDVTDAVPIAQAAIEFRESVD